MNMKCENGCGKFNTQEKRPVKRYYDNYGNHVDLCFECFITDGEEYLKFETRETFNEIEIEESEDKC